MTHRSPYIAVLISAGCLLFVGCSPSNSPTPSPSSESSLRPADIAVDRIEPCSMLTEQQTTQLGVRGVRGSTVETVDGQPSPGCGWIVDASRPPDDRTTIDYNSQIISQPISAALGSPGATPTQVNRFDALVIPPVADEADPFCQVAVDAAPHTTIRVQALLQPNAPRIPDGELCRRATDAASMVMTTVVATASR